MPYWYYDKKDLQNTPSFRDGIANETEMRYRKEGARFIIDIGLQMDLGYNTVATGVVYYHRFYMFHSFRTFPRFITGCCCLLLAGKVEETPKKCRDIIKMAKILLTEEKFSTFGDDPKEEVMTLERILLQTIKFELQVEHPYGYLLKYAKCLKGDKTKLQKMVQMAWTFVNDSLCTTLCLQWEPEVIAVALMFLAGKLSKFEVVDWNGRQPKHKAWWDMFVADMTMELLEDICHQVLDLYSPQPQTGGTDSPPARAPARPIPKHEKKPSVTPPASSSSSSPVASKPVVTPIKNEEPKLESKADVKAQGYPPYPVYTVPPPVVPRSMPPTATRPPVPPLRVTVPPHPPPPLGYQESRPRSSRFPVNVPPPYYSPHGRGASVRPRRTFTPGPPPPPRLY